MLPKEIDTERLTDSQVSDLLKLALTSKPGVEVDRWSSLPGQQLIGELRTVLERHDLGLKEVSRLLDVNELTLKSWLNASKDLPEMAHEKLAALGSLLSTAMEEGSNEDVLLLVQAAVSLAKGQPIQQSPTVGEGLRVVSATFGPTGLMAAALYLSLHR
jgi:hypothetical protein